MAKRRILLADDSVTIQKVVNLTFADEDIDVIAVGDGDAAMQNFLEVKPNLVMADVNMPGLNGYQICETIKQNDETKQIPVILLVGSFEPFDEDKARAVGADDFLTKPFQSIRQLVNKVSDLLAGEKNNDSSEETANSFDDTLEMNPPADDSPEPENLGDAAMDDEMIQTNQIGSLPENKAQEFESEPTFSPLVEDKDFGLQKQPYHYESLEEFEKENDWTETPPSPESDFDEIKISLPGADEAEPAVKNNYESADEKDSFDDVQKGLIEQDESRPSRSAPASVINFDDSDLLELPRSEKGFFIVPQGEPENSEGTGKTFGEETAAAKFSAPANSLSPEMIEAIADKVVEKISHKLIKKIVEEVIAQTAENE